MHPVYATHLVHLPRIQGEGSRWFPAASIARISSSSPLIIQPIHLHILVRGSKFIDRGEGDGHRARDGGGSSSPQERAESC